MIVNLVLLCAFLISFICNLYLIYIFKREKSKNKLTGEQSYDCKQLLHDITAGAGMVKITRVNPDDVMMLSPRGRL